MYILILNYRSIKSYSKNSNGLIMPNQNNGLIDYLIKAYLQQLGEKKF